MPPFTVQGTTPILVFGEGDQMQGEVWLSNPTVANIGITGGSLTVDFVPPQTGAISFAAEAGIEAGGTQRLAIKASMQTVTPPGTYVASVALDTTVGTQIVPATLVVAGVFLPGLGPMSMTFSGVTPSSTFNGSVVVRNRGNTDIAVNPIPDETLVEVVTFPRVLEVGAGGTVTVEPAPSLTAGGTATFTNNNPIVTPGNWAQVDFALHTPVVLDANRHFRVLPRIANLRFAVDLLT